MKMLVNVQVLAKDTNFHVLYCFYCTQGGILSPLLLCVSLSV